MKIEGRNLSLTYQDKLVLENISFTLESGNRLALIGSSGSGKSSLIKGLIGLPSFYQGEVKVDGNMLTNDWINRFRRRVGYVIQGGGLFPHLTVKENALVLVRSMSLADDDCDKRFTMYAELAQLESKLFPLYPHQLSGGQKQRAALVRALVHEPELLILDEPFSALDPVIRYTLQRDVKALIASLKKSLILVTHDLNEAKHFADQISFMHDGKILQTGKFLELKENPKHKLIGEFFTAQLAEF